MNVLGTETFLTTPDVNGQLVMLNGGGSGTITTGDTATRPTAGIQGNIYIDTTLNCIYIDTGVNWATLSAGNVLQIVTGTIPSVTGTTTVATALTAAPTTAGGVLVWTQAFTPISASSKIIISFTLTLSHGTAARTVIASCFAGTTNVGAISTYIATVNVPYVLPYYIVYSPGSISPITFTARVGATASGTIAVNRVNTTTGTLGGAAVTEYTITEIL